MLILCQSLLPRGRTLLPILPPKSGFRSKYLKHNTVASLNIAIASGLSPPHCFCMFQYVQRSDQSTKVSYLKFYGPSWGRGGYISNMKTTRLLCLILTSPDPSPMCPPSRTQHAMWMSYNRKKISESQIEYNLWELTSYA